MAAPASADHTVDAVTTTKHGACVIGELESGAGVPVPGRVLRTKSSGGRLTSLTCQFTDYPRFVSAEGNDILNEDLYLPKHGFTYGVLCDVALASRGSVYADGVLAVKGNGHATVTCDSFYYS